MIAFVTGILDTVSESSIIVENNGIGYEILVPGSVVDNLPPAGGEVKIYTYTHVREDALQLFGFLERDSLAMFKLLIAVGGVGPKGALGILTALNPDALRSAVISDDAKAIAKAPGIGAKTAGRIILELRDKIKSRDLITGVPEEPGGNAPGAGTAEDAAEALEALGFSKAQARAAVGKVQGEGMTVEEILKESLRVIQ